MKRFVVLFLLLSVSFATQAHARWITKEIKWTISNVGAPFDPTGIYVRDTIRTAIGPVDTTGAFSLDLASPPPRGMATPAGQAIGGINGDAVAGSDTTTVAWIVLQADSSAAPTAGLTSATMILDGRVGGYGPSVNLARGWVKADSALVSGAAGKTLILGDESVGFPIRSVSPYGNVLRWGEFRARISGAGTALSAARVFLRYWLGDCGQ